MRHGETMREISNTAARRAEMLWTIGVADNDLLEPNLRWTPPDRRSSPVTMG